VLYGALPLPEQSGERGLAAKALDYAIGGVGRIGHHPMITKISLTSKEVSVILSW
jgi:hypothetical protein